MRKLSATSSAAIVDFEDGARMRDICVDFDDDRADFPVEERSSDDMNMFMDIALSERCCSARTNTRSAGRTTGGQIEKASFKCIPRTHTNPMERYRTSQSTARVRLDTGGPVVVGPAGLLERAWRTVHGSDKLKTQQDEEIVVADSPEISVQTSPSRRRRSSKANKAKYLSTNADPIADEAKGLDVDKWSPAQPSQISPSEEVTALVREPQALSKHAADESAAASIERPLAKRSPLCRRAKFVSAPSCT